MRRSTCILAACVAVVVAACGKQAEPRPAFRAVAGDLAIVGATVVPMDRPGALAGHTVIVRGDRIVAVAPAAAIDARAATPIDATGKWLMPGLADMHVHMWGQDALALFLLNGVTTVRNLTGTEEHLRWRDAIAKGEMTGPMLITSGRIIDGDPPTWPGSAIATTAEAARAEVRAQKAAGYDWIKVYSGLPLEAYEAALDEAKQQGLPVAGHVPKAVGLAKAIASGQRTIEHLDGYVPFFGDPPADAMIEATVAARVWNCPTLVVTDRFGKMDDPAQLATTRGLAYVSPFMRSAWEPKHDFRLQRFTSEMFETVRAKNLKRRETVLALQRAGANLVLGTDTGNPYVVPGFSVLDELQLLVASGLTPWEALHTATAAPAELVGTPGAFGVIATGARADLIVLDRDPLADVAGVADPSIVIVRGKPYPRAELLAAVQAPAAAADPFAKLPALAPEGTAPITARYEIAMHELVIGHERAAIGRLPDGARVVQGQAVYTAPQPVQLTYRATRDHLDLTTDALSPPHAVITRRGTAVVATQDGAEPIELAAAVDAAIAPQAIAEFVWYADALADLAVDKTRTLTAAEVLTEGALAVVPGAFTFTRTPDAGGRRRYTLTGTHGDMAVTGAFTVDTDGAPHEVTVTVKFGTFVTRRFE